MRLWRAEARPTKSAALSDGGAGFSSPRARLAKGEARSPAFVVGMGSSQWLDG